jgi:hypothetical protein
MARAGRYRGAITIDGRPAGPRPRASVRGGRPSSRKVKLIVSPKPTSAGADRSISARRFSKLNTAPGEQPPALVRRVG